LPPCHALPRTKAARRDPRGRWDDELQLKRGEHSSGFPQRGENDRKGVGDSVGDKAKGAESLRVKLRLLRRKDPRTKSGGAGRQQTGSTGGRGWGKLSPWTKVGNRKGGAQAKDGAQRSKRARGEHGPSKREKRRRLSKANQLQIGQGRSKRASAPGRGGGTAKKKFRAFEQKKKKKTAPVRDHKLTHLVEE